MPHQTIRAQVRYTSLMSRRTVARVFTLIIALVFVALGVTQQGAARPPQAAAPDASTHTATASVLQQTPAAPTQAGPVYPVVKVVDGDTIEVEKDGKVVKVRLIGIDTPEVVDPRKVVQCFGREASAEAHRLLDGQSVSLETDPSQDTHDKYGRLLAYARLPDGTFFNEHMIAAGFAHEYTYHVPYKYQARFKAAEKTAREAEQGLWAATTCAGDTTQPAAPLSTGH